MHFKDPFENTQCSGACFGSLTSNDVDDDLTVLPTLPTQNRW